MIAAPSVSYRYASPSALSSDGTGSRLSLATSGGSTPAGEVDSPYFFQGFVERPAVVAQALLLLARVARTRFYVPPNALAAVLRAADPVITATPDGLRFEAFSVCCGVYARLDIDAGALDIAHLAAGVTNVDVNPPLRQALAGLRPSEPLHLRVGEEELRVATLDDELVEESVPLPTRWLKGFAETQVLFAGMSLRHELSGIAVSRFIQSLPRASSTKSALWATHAGRALRLASRPTPGAVCVAGPERLRVLEPLLRFATGLRAYGPDAHSDSLPMSSAWVLEMPGARVTIGLSPEKSRGFSGEGALLTSLAADVEPEALRLVSNRLAFQSRIQPGRLAADVGLPENDIAPILGALASFGQLGFDFRAEAYFHRPLPMRTELLDDLHPRFSDARKLVEDGCVSDGGDSSYVVRSAEAQYRVVLGVDEDRCTCLWYTRHRGTRGPCKHVLAARTWAGHAPEAACTA
ncbi:SWIM zinc finger family protein [Frondihabitans cladoniiphilus]|uniref:SWIM zinc finger domain-containing protein n=1 Tax=Frondihabitans cladoniiphilus TaxID=715785 RepID=A0ABP8VHT0_9MICO